MQNVGVDELQTGIKIAWRNNLRHADDTTLMAERKEELKSFLMRVKEDCEKVSLELNIKKLRLKKKQLRSWHPDHGTLHGK